jgi:hypothetical protein
MNTVPLFLSSPQNACLLLILRAIELQSLCWYMRAHDWRASRFASALALAAAFISYTFIYEVRNYTTSLGLTLLIHLLHLLIWGALIYILYRPSLGRLISIDLLFFLFTRSARWLFLSISRNSGINGLAWWSSSYLFTWIPNLILFLLLVRLADQYIPARSIVGDKRSNVLLSLLTALFLFIRYNTGWQSTMSTYFQLCMLILAYLFILIAAFIVIGLSILRVRQEEQRQILLLSEAKYQEALNRMDADSSVKRLYHDIHKHLSAIGAVSGDNKKVMDYIGSIRDELSKTELLADTGSAILDSLLSQRIQQARQNDIQLICDVDMRQAEFIAPLDVCAIFGNAIDNAYEAALKVQEPNRRLIKVKAKMMGSFLAIRISNYYAQEPEIRDGKLLTNKEDKQLHGIGLNSIRHAAEKYGGSVDVQLDQPGIFVLKILIPADAERSGSADT